MEMKNEVLFSSSDAPLIGLASDVVYLEDGVGGIVSAESIEFLVIITLGVHSIFKTICSKRWI